MVKIHNTKTLLPTHTCAPYHARPRREEIHQPDVILELGALQPISFSLKVKKIPSDQNATLFVLFSMSWCRFQQINTICSSLPFGVDEEEMKEFHGNGRDTAADQPGWKADSNRKLLVYVLGKKDQVHSRGTSATWGAQREHNLEMFWNTATRFVTATPPSITVGSLVLLAPTTKTSPPASTADLPPRACRFLAMDSVTKNILFHHQQGRAMGSLGTDFFPFSWTKGKNPTPSTYIRHMGPNYCVPNTYEKSPMRASVRVGAV